MTAVRNRYAALRAATLTVAALSQLQGTVSGPLMFTSVHALPGGRHASDGQPNPKGYRFSFYNVSGYVSASPQALLAGYGYQLAGANWPNPGRPAWRPDAIIGGSALNLTTLGEPSTLPSGRHDGDDQPNPRGYTYPVSLRTWTIPALTMTPHEIPTGRHAGDDQPVPRGPRHPHQGVVSAPPMVALLAPPEFTYVSRPPLVTRWAAPRFPIDLRTWTNNLLETTLASAPAITNVFRPPLITRWAAKPYPVALRTWIPPNLYLTTLAGQDEVPLTCGWGNPPTGAQYPATLRSITQNLLSNTLSAPPDFPAGRHAGDHQPNPRGYSYPVSLRSHILGPVPQTAPGLQIVALDRPNPVTRHYPVALRTWIYTNANLRGADDLPTGGPAYDWPNPRGYAYPVSLRTWMPRPFEAGLSPAPPFVPIDWPNPRGYEYPAALRSILVNLQESTLAGQGVTISGGIDIELTVCREKTVELTVTRTLSITLKV